MPAKNFYDAVLVGLNLPSLLVAALLSKRGFRVLLIGHGQPWPSYQVRGVRFPTAPFSLPAPGSPLLARIFSELALRPLLTRRTKPLLPAFQAVMPGHRVDFTLEPALLVRELTRELPEAHHAMEELLRSAAHSDQAIEALLERDLMWPPEGFFERRDFTRALSTQPLGDDAPRPIWPELAADTPVGRVLASCLDHELDASPRGLRILRGVLSAAALDEGGLSGLYELLIECIRHHNGSLRLNERVDRLTIKRGALSAVHSFPSDEEIGCHHLLWALPVARLAPLLDDRSMLDPLFAEVGEPQPLFSRFTLNLLLHARAIPEGMARRALVIDRESIWVDVERTPDGAHAVLSAEARIPVRDAAHALTGQRERMLEGLSTLSPFLREHLELIDSPHDGLAVQDVQTGASFMPSETGRRGPDTMETVYAYPHKRIHGTVALDVRTPIKRLMLCNTQVVPGLGFEGTLLSALSAARAVTRSLGRDWMNRGRWTKVEL
jgi:phytoene dehydrogenase-like protein